MSSVRKPSPSRCLAALVACVATAGSVARVPASAASVRTQSQTPTTTTTTTVAPSLVLTMSFEIPINTTSAGLPTGTSVKATVTVNNPSAVTFTNQSMVLRFGQKPDLILSVDDGTGKVGVMDRETGAWYHTIASIAPNSITTYTVTYAKVCAGRWAFAARVGEKITSQFVQWAGNSDIRCLADETTNPQPPSFYQLPWPPSVVSPSTTTTTLASGSAVIAGQTASTSTSTSTTLASSATSTSRPPSASTSTISVLPTRPGAVSTVVAPVEHPSSTTTTTTMVTTTTTAASRSTVTTTTKAVPYLTSRATTTTLLYCRTVAGTRSCGPKPASFKPVKKAQSEVKTTTTKNKKKKKQ
jgi:hypothetical protein